tara:strand:+ start:2463 stop:4568 length:2106 start_codon:yes stop_codon:yes gene_type:complete
MADSTLQRYNELLSQDLSKTSSSKENFNKRIDNVKKTVNRQTAGNPYVNSAELLLSGFGQAAGYFGDELGEFVPAYISEPSEKIAESLGNAMMSTDFGKKVAEFATETAEEYPRSVDAAGNFLNLAAVAGAGAGVKSMGSSLGKVANRTSLSTATHIPKFYEDPVRGKVNFLKAYGSSIPSAIAESVSPSKRAATRVLGVQEKKIVDILGDSGEDAEFTASSIWSQTKNDRPDGETDNALTVGPISLNYIAKDIPIDDKETLAFNIGNGFRKENDQIPQEIVDRAVNHLGIHKKTKADHFVQVKDPQGGGGAKGNLESIGKGGSGASVVRAFSTNMSDDYLNFINNIRKSKKEIPYDKLPPNLVVEFAQITASLSKDNAYIFEKLGIGKSLIKKEYDIDPETNLPVKEKVINPKTGKSRLKKKDKQTVFQKDPDTGELLLDPDTKKPIPVRENSAESTNKIADLILKARYKQYQGIPLKKGSKEELALNTFNMSLDRRRGDPRRMKLAGVKDENKVDIGNRDLTKVKGPEKYLFLQQSFNSRQQELGGANAFFAVDPYKEDMFTMINDGHDIFGINPVGGTGLVTAQPIIKHSYRGKQTFDNQQIKGRLTPDNLEAASKRVEKLTGVKRTAEEADMSQKYYTAAQMSYNKRALSEANIKPTVADTKAALKSQGKIALPFSVGAGIGIKSGLMAAEENKQEE